MTIKPPISATISGIPENDSHTAQYKEDLGLYRHGKRELTLAGLLDEDSDYNGMLGKSVLELIETFSKQGHSGFSAASVVELFSILASFKILEPDKFIPCIAEAHDVSEMSGVSPGTMWQSSRLSDVFSNDGGRTWYSVTDPNYMFIHLSMTNKGESSNGNV